MVILDRNHILICSVDHLIPFTAGDLGQNVAEMEHEFSYDLLGNDLEGKFGEYQNCPYPTFLNQWNWLHNWIWYATFWYSEFEDISNRDIEKFSKSFSGRRHAIGMDSDNNALSLIDGMFAKQLGEGL